jgi:HEAT repeat protein
VSDWRSQRDQALLVLDREKRRETRIDAAHVLRDLAREQRQLASEFRSAIDCLLKDSEPEVRRAGLQVAGAVLLPEELEPLPASLPAIQGLFQRLMLPPFERTQAAGAMAKLGDPEGGRHLLKRTQRRWSLDRAFAIELCGDVQVTGALERLLEILQDVDDPYRGAAARGLGRLRDPRALEPLINLFEEAGISDDLRLDAAEGLCLLGIPQARAHVESALAGWASASTRQALEQLLEAYP